MNQLFPIVRRERRSLLPPDDVVVAASPVVVEPPTPAPVAETQVESVSAETTSDAPVEQAAPSVVAAAEQSFVAPTPAPQGEAASFALATEVAPVEPKPKKGRRRGNTPE